MALAPGEVRLQVYGSALGAHPGAEQCGLVVEAGDAAHEWTGRKVVAPRLLPCGECGLCQRGRVASCPARRRRGAPSAEEILPARFLLPLGPPLFDREVPTEELWRYAALPDALGAPYAALCRAGIAPGELVAVLGGGARAAAAVLVVRALGCQTVVLAPGAAADGPERRRLRAPPFSALDVLDSAALDPQGALEAVLAIARGAELPGHGPCLLETTGSDAGRARALGMVTAGATAVLLDRGGREGPDGSDLPAPLPAGPGLAGPAVLDRLCTEQGNVIGAGPAHPDLLPELLALVARGAIDLPALTVSVAPADIDGVLARRRRGEGDRLTLPIVRFL